MVRITVMLMLLVPLPASRVLACSCIGGITPRQKIDQATFIFTGRVASIENPQQARLDAIADPVARRAAWQAGVDQSHVEGWGPHHGRRVLFEDVTVYAGSATQTVELWTGQGDGDCGITVYEGLSYVVFGSVNNRGRAIAGLCGGTLPLVCAREELLLLGEPETLVLPTIDEPVPLYSLPCLEWPKLHTDRRNLEGIVHHAIEVDLVIDREGRVSHLAFKKPQRPGLERIIRSWCFKPAMLHGKPVPVRLTRISGSFPQ